MSREKIEQAGLTQEQFAVLVDLLRERDAGAGQTADIEVLSARLDAMQAEMSALAAKIGDLQLLESPVFGPLLHDEIKTYLKDSDIGFSAPAQPIQFDLFCSDSLDFPTLVRRDLFLDEKTLDRLYEESFSHIGVIGANKTWRFVNQAAVKLSERLGKRFAERVGVPAALLTEALFTSVAGELPRLIPARHMARRIARMSGGDLVLIPLTGTTFTYLHGHQLEPFYLAAELKRRGIPVAFVCSDPAVLQQARGGDTLPFRFQPDPALWTLPPLPDIPDAKTPPEEGRAALVPAGIRGIAYILRKVKDPIKFQSPVPLIMDPAFGEAHRAVLDPRHLPVALTLQFRRVAATGHLGRLGILLSCRLPHGDLSDFLAGVMGGVVAQALKRAMVLVKQEKITEAHICEHPFFESAVIAHAVRSNGGRVVLWPHGWGVSWWGLPRHPGTADEVYSVDQPGGDIWRKRLPGTSVRVVSDLYIPRYRAPRPPVPSEPLNVVIIGNCDRNDRLPLIDIKSVVAISRKLYPALAELPADVRWTYRPRGTPDLQLQWELAGRPADYSYTTVPPALIDLPNMVFLFPALLSSAMMEGINRGIPVMIAREDDTIEDYTGSEPGDCIPMGSVSFIMEEILRCRDPAYRQALTDAQVAWCETTQLNWEGA